MSWEEELFGVLDDLEQQAESLYDAEREVELADRSRAEYQLVTLAGRLMASVDTDVALEVVGAGWVRGRLERVSLDWLLVHGGQGDTVVRTAAIGAAEGISERAVPEVAWSPVARLGLGSALRRLADAQEECLLHRMDASRQEGTPTRVGADFVEVRLSTGVPRTLLMPFASLATIRSR